jgi:hypothetical protein
MAKKDIEIIEELKGMTKAQLIGELKGYGIKPEHIESKTKAELKDLLVETKVASKEIEEPEKEMAEIPGTKKVKVKDKKEALELQRKKLMVGYDPKTKTAIVKAHANIKTDEEE